MALRVVTQGAEETRSLGEALGGLLGAGDVVTLSGEMGSGKTTLAQGLGRGLGVSEPVCSPTFALVQEYEGRLSVWHLDTYRVASPDELLDLGWAELMQGEGVVLIEWPERIAAALPTARLDISLSGDRDERTIDLRAEGARMEDCLAALARRMPESLKGRG